MGEDRLTETKLMPPKLEDGVQTQSFHIVAPKTWGERIEAWRRKQARIPNKSEAIRMLVEQALDATRDGEKR